MLRSRSSALVAGLVLLGVTHTAAEPLCQPVLTIEALKFANVNAAQRVWTAQLDVDASRCAAASGRFAIDFVRLKEGAPDLRFTEHFTWKPGRIEVSADFAADEYVLDFSIRDIAPCACRQ